MVNTELSDSEFGSVGEWRRRCSSPVREIENGDAGVARGDPEPAEAVARQRAHALQVGARRASCAGDSSLPVCALRNTTPPPSVPIHKPSSLGTSEEIQPLGSDLLVAAIVAQLAEFVAVEAIESVFGAEPHEAFGVLRDGIDGLLRQAFFEAVALHAERRSGDAAEQRKMQASAAHRDARAQADGLIFPRVIGIVAGGGRLQPTS